jgi:ketosteroid isomerase-like protein
MSQTAIDTLLAEYEAIARQDWPAVFRETHPDFEFIPPDRGLGAAIARGREDAREAVQSFFSPFEEVIIEPQEFHERGDRIVVFFLLRTRPRGSSAMVEIRAGHVWTMRDGKPARLEVYPEREEALKAAEAAGTEREITSRPA